MRTFGRNAQNAASLPLGQFENIPAGTLIEIWAVAAAADVASMLVMWNTGVVLGDRVVPVEAAAGAGPNLDRDIPIVRHLTTEAGRLQLNLVAGGSTVDFVIGITP